MKKKQNKKNPHLIKSYDSWVLTAHIHKLVEENSAIVVPRLFEEKRRDTVFGFLWGVVRGSEFLVGILSP